MEEISQEQLENFVKQVVNIERKYGYELRNVTTEKTTRNWEMAEQIHLGGILE
ncbi:MAG: hypothetical protein IPG67_17040 [Acidobacteria bacterium]|nr:hypothetical protein [Acidobacteriota bacterium]